MALIKQMVSSKTDEWETPNDLYQDLNEAFDFKIDLAANSTNTKCKSFLGKGSEICEDSLKYDWNKIPELFPDKDEVFCWLNPPYSTKLQDAFIKKCCELSNNKVIVCALIPVRTSTKRWKKLAEHTNDIFFLKNRLKFISQDKIKKTAGATFSSALIFFNSHYDMLYNHDFKNIRKHCYTLID